MSVLRPITGDEYAAWLETVIPEYAADKVASGQWSEDSALELSRKEYEDLLPGGKDTENNHIHTVLDPEGRPVGTLWFGVKDRAKKRVAYVFDIVVGSEHRRRGHAFRAFLAMEQEVARLGLDGIALHVFGHNQAAHALYVKLGYVATNINMFKPVARSHA
ncbi:MAG: GNAT family N-acetyltransferase [Rubrivivax sp.]|nr:GNAT family N-acetyltransferase [Rubrivivax sp.]